MRTTASSIAAVARPGRSAPARRRATGRRRRRLDPRGTPSRAPRRRRAAAPRPAARAARTSSVDPVGAGGDRADRRAGQQHVAGAVQPRPRARDRPRAVTGPPPRSSGPRRPGRRRRAGRRATSLRPGLRRSAPGRPGPGRGAPPHVGADVADHHAPRAGRRPRSAAACRTRPGAGLRQPQPSRVGVRADRPGVERPSSSSTRAFTASTCVGGQQPAARCRTGW